MSAFIVSKAHIDAMVQAAVRSGSPARGGYTLRWRIGKPEWTGDNEAYLVQTQALTREATHKTRDRIGAMLWNENMNSVDHRYDTHAPSDREVYRFKESRVTDHVAILKAIDCYEYQSCEHPEWEASEAYAFCQALRRAMIHSLPGYDAAPWGID